MSTTTTTVARAVLDQLQLFFYSQSDESGIFFGVCLALFFSGRDFWALAFHRFYIPDSDLHSISSVTMLASAILDTVGKFTVFVMFGVAIVLVPATHPRIQDGVKWMRTLAEVLGVMLLAAFVLSVRACIQDLKAVRDEQRRTGKMATWHVRTFF